MMHCAVAREFYVEQTATTSSKKCRLFVSQFLVQKSSKTKIDFSCASRKARKNFFPARFANLQKSANKTRELEKANFVSGAHKFNKNSGPKKMNKSLICEIAIAYNYKKIGAGLNAHTHTHTALVSGFAFNLANPK